MANIKFSELPNLGNITANTTVPVVSGGQNYTVTTANLQAYVNSNATITGTSVSVSGNVIAGAYLNGDGSQITNLPVQAGTYSNANVAAYLPIFGGNLLANVISATGNISGNYILGNGSQLTGIATSYGNSNVATFMAAFGSNTISTSGNITSGYILGNGSALTGMYGNTQVSAYLGTYTGGMTAMTGNVTTTANIQGAYIKGDGSALTNVTANAALQGNLVGNIQGNGFGTNALSFVSATGNVTGNYIKGNGSELTGIVTSLQAGTGISVSAATGTITISATGGGGGGSSISNGTSNVAIAASGGSIGMVVAGNNRLTINNLGPGFAGIIANTGIQTDSLFITTGGQLSCQSPASFSGNVTLAGGSIGIVNPTIVNPNMSGSTGTGVILPYATVSVTRTYTGQVGSIRAVTDSPTNAGRMCYWCTTNSRWQYIDTNGAV